MYWSNGLKALLGVTETTDEELNAMEDEHASVLAELTDKDWQAVLWSRCEASLLDMAETETNPEAIPEFLKALKRDFRDEKKERQL